jgi:hypothetical protein
MDTESETSQSPDKVSAHEWIHGIGLLLLLHILQIPFALMTYFLSLMFIGLTQLIYVIPAILIYGRKGYLNVVKVLIIGAAITFLLNGTCVAVIFYRLKNP